MGRIYKGIIIEDQRDELLTQMGKETLLDRYAVTNKDGTKERFQEIFARSATYYADNIEHAQRLYDYISKHWFMPSTPILSNGGTNKGFPISCFLNTCEDTLEGIWDNFRENMRLAAIGGGIGTYYGNLRSIGEKAGAGETSGIMPFGKILDAQTLAISQAGLRRGSAAVYIQIEHPEVEEFLTMRKPTGGDENRKCLNLNHGLVISDNFMYAVANNDMWYYKSPKTGLNIYNKNGEPKCIKARELWSRILDIRMETGEPYLLFIDTVNAAVKESHKKKDLYITTSNLCCEVLLPTTKDRTAVCCLSSINGEKYSEWKGNTQFIKDVHRFVDNVITDFINKANEEIDGVLKYPELQKAVYSASQERSIGIGFMGFHALLQSMNISFESEEARFWNKKIFSWIQKTLDESDIELALEKGPCPDSYNGLERNIYKTAIAPTASISIFASNTSPSIEPFSANAYAHKTKSGTFLVKNRYLEKLLDKKGYNTQEIWNTIINNLGSVEHLEFLSPEEKQIFKTSYEIDQHWVIIHAADRAPYIEQGASNNLFFKADVSKSELHDIQYDAWRLGVKGLYYCRSTVLKGAGNISEKVERVKLETNITEDECLSCQ